MKKVLWEQLNVDSAVPANAYRSTAIFSFCPEDGGSTDVAGLVSNSSEKAPLLLSLFLIVAFTFPGQSQKQQRLYSYPDGAINAKVPLYLKLGRLIYYC